jgi:Lrp/AsnC family transcriptional regulator
MSFTNLERQLLEALQHDADISISELSDKLHQSKSTLWRAIKKLEDSGVIDRRVVLLNARKVNLPLTVYVSVRTNQHNDTWSRQFRDIVEGIPEILEVHRMSGDLDYLIKAAVTDMDDYDRVYQQLIRANLFDVSSSFVMETIKATTALPLNHLTSKA